MESILFRADSSKKLGTGIGHITRDIFVAKSLTSSFEEIVFLTKDNPPMVSLIKECGFQTMILPDIDDENLLMSKTEIILKNRFFDTVIIDLPNIKQDVIDNYRRYGNTIVVFSDANSKLKYRANIIFAFSTTQKQEYYANSVGENIYLGLKYFPLNPKFSIRNYEICKSNVNNILVTLGGSDGSNLTYKVLDVLIAMDLKCNIVAIFGYGFGQIDRTLKNKYEKNGIIIKKHVKNMHEEMIKADIAISSAGNTAVELMCLGIPMLVLPQTERENGHAINWQNEGAILKTHNFGSKITDDEITKDLKRLISDLNLRNKLKKQGMQTVDGKGINRMEKILCSEQD